MENDVMRKWAGSPAVMVFAVLAAVAIFRAPEIIKAINPVAPGPVSPDNPQPIVDLETRVKQAMAADPSAALKYAALYQVAQGVVSDDSRSARQIQQEIERSLKLLGLESSPEFISIVRQHLGPYGGANPDRAAWNAALGQLSEACRKASD